jgi:catechol 2,3-dioxygenase-like lactoylglutathione lyase family enzyme
MLSDSKAFSGIGVDDLEAARRFYGETLGQRIEVLDEGNGLMTLHLAGERPTLIYQSPGMTPASYTVLNFPVDDVEAAVDHLAARGVEFERYEGSDQDEKGIAHGPGPDIAWFKDPSGNVISVHSDPPA